MAWGQHLIVDMADCNRAAVSSPDAIRAFSNELVERIDMVAFGEPIIQHFATHSVEAAGYSLVQLIETSNITAHFSDHSGDIYLDVFSCKSFNEQIVLDVCEKHFQPQSYSKFAFQRDARRGITQGQQNAA